MATQTTQVKNKVHYRNNILFLLSNGYHLIGFTAFDLNDDFGVKKQITYHFRRKDYDQDFDVDHIDITEYNLFNIDLQMNSTFRNKYHLGGND